MAERRQSKSRGDFGAMNVENEYRLLVEAMTVAERVRRAEALFRWSREYLARSIRAKYGPMSEARLKREVALRQYGSDPAARRLIAEWPVDVSD
jgi:hypothetical protein